MPLFLGIDVGTSALRTVVIDGRGSICAQSRVELPAAETSNADSGGLQQDPFVWWHATADALAQLAPLISLSEISHLCIDATSATTLLCDQRGQPLLPALMYNDSRAQAQARQIAALAPAGHICSSPSSALAKALWLFQRLTPQQQRDCRIQHQADWLSAMFTGSYGVSDDNNCLKLGYDSRARRWPAWLSQLPFPATAFPRVLIPGSVIGQIDVAVAQRFGLSERCQIVAGTTDSTASIIAAGELQVGDAVTTLGSTLVLKVVNSNDINDAKHGVYSHYYFGRYLTGGASNTGGAVLRHFFSQTEIERLSLDIDAEKDSPLDYYPLLRAGERFPIADANLAPRMNPRPQSNSEFLHALMFAIAKIEKLGYDLLHTLGAPYPKRVITMGGGANSEVWRRMRERQLGRPVENTNYCESALGAAMLARSSNESTEKH